MVASSATPNKGDLIWVNFGQSVGREQSGKCPAVVLSPKTYNRNSGLVLISLITPNKKGNPFEIPIRVGAINGVVLADQARSIDWHARRVSIIDHAPANTVSSIISKLKLLLG